MIHMAAAVIRIFLISSVPLFFIFFDFYDVRHRPSCERSNQTAGTDKQRNIPCFDDSFGGEYCSVRKENSGALVLSNSGGPREGIVIKGTSNFCLE